MAEIEVSPVSVGQVWQYSRKSGLSYVFRHVQELLPYDGPIKVIVATRCTREGRILPGDSTSAFLVADWNKNYTQVDFPPPPSEKEFVFYVMMTKNLAGEVSTMKVLSESSTSANEKKKAMYRLTFSHDGDVMKTERL